MERSSYSGLGPPAVPYCTQSISSYTSLQCSTLLVQNDYETCAIDPSNAMLANEKVHTSFILHIQLSIVPHTLQYFLYPTMPETIQDHRHTQLRLRLALLGTL